MLLHHSRVSVANIKKKQARIRRGSVVTADCMSCVCMYVLYMHMCVTEGGVVGGGCALKANLRHADKHTPDTHMYVFNAGPLAE